MIVECAPILPNDRLSARLAKGVGRQRQMFASRSITIDPALEAIVMKAITKNPDHRYQSAGELAVEINDYLQGRPVRALTDRKKAKDASRKSLRLRRVLQIGVVLVVLLGLMLWMHGRAPVQHLVAPTASAGALVVAETSPPKIQLPVPLSFTPNAAGLMTFSNSLKMKFVVMPPGSFMMGSSDVDPDRKPDETLHHVSMQRKFAMAANLVTRGEFSQFVRESGYQSIVELSGDAHDRISNTDIAARNWHNPGFAQTDDDPVAAVSWYDAKAFCEWLGKKEKRHYRLPTEAEYEYSCRAGTQTIYFMGNNPSDFGDYAWYNVNSFTGTHPVGTNKPNPWGLYDMCGNLISWCEDWFDPDLKADAIDPTGPATGTTKSLRGGTWGRSQFQCRCANRTQSLPDRTNNVWGMRLAMDMQ
jgi:formylglycine-generating enzyme required for sulfatase activity